jgi:hypothetical protein
MAKKGFIAIGLPAPKDVKSKGKDYGEAEGDEAETDAESEDEDADKAAGVSAMSDFLKVIGSKGVDPDKAYDAFKDLMEHC